VFSLILRTVLRWGERKLQRCVSTGNLTVICHRNPADISLLTSGSLIALYELSSEPERTNDGKA